MSTTNDERREVAARLRDYAQLRNCYPFEAFYVRLNIALFEDNGWDRTDGYVFDYLADLIDPVCHNQHPRASNSCFCCSECARTSRGVGARVVSDDDQR